MIAFSQILAPAFFGFLFFWCLEKGFIDMWGEFWDYLSPKSIRGPDPVAHSRRASSLGR